MIFTLLFWNTYDQEEKPAIGEPALNEVQLQTWLKDSLEQNPETYGAVALVDIPGQADWQGAIGWQKTSDNLVLNTDSMFVFSGLAQPLLATIALQLAEEGYFSLDAPIHPHLTPDLLYLLTERHRQELNFWHLLNHSSGLFDNLNADKGPYYTAPDSLSERVRTAFQSGVSYSIPGTGFHYSEVNYLLLSILLEKITGLKIHQLLEQRLFEPLGMQRSMQCSLTDVVSTASDLRRYVHALASGALLGDSVRLRKILGTAHGGYKFGWRIFKSNDNGNKIWGHAGAGSGCHSCLLYFEEQDAIVVYAANTYAKARNELPPFVTKLFDALKKN